MPASPSAERSLLHIVTTGGIPGAIAGVCYRIGQDVDLETSCKRALCGGRYTRFGIEPGEGQLTYILRPQKRL